MANDGRLEMLRMFQNGKGSSDFSDFTIVVDNSEFHVHKIILASRSSYFQALFASNMSECENRRLIFDDIEVDVFERLLKYIYTLELNLDVKYALKLMVPGDKYGLEVVVDLCENYLLNNMKREIAAQCFLVGHLLGKKELKENAFSSMADDWKSTCSTDGWKELVKNHSLMTEIERTECIKQNQPPPGISQLIRRNEGALEWSVNINKGVTSHSPTFSLLDNDQSFWRLWFKCENSRCYLYLTHIGPPLATPVTCSYSIRSTNSWAHNMLKKTIDTSCCFSRNFRCSTLLAYFPTRDVNSDTLTVKLTPTNPEPSPQGFINHLDLGRFTDAVVNVGGETFPCHKVALAYASPVFYEAFKDKTELQLNDGMKPETFKTLLLVIYRSQQLPQDLHFDLLTAAKRFELKDEWLNRCRALVFRTMKDEHLMDFLIDSHAQQDPIQMRMAFKEMANNFEEIVKSQDCCRMAEHEGLHHEFFKFLMIEKRSVPRWF